MQQETRVLSGIQPTGKLHLGNYLGALKNWVAMQDEFPNACYYCIVDLHAITVPYDHKGFRDNVFGAALDFLAAGLNPDISSIFVQSQIRDHVELQWLLQTLTPLGLLERMTQFKDKRQKQVDSIGAGLLSYPVLMAADILIYKAGLVPVGDDQTQHLELTRELARKFNHTFGETFPEPEARLTKGARIMSLTNPANKMSKSDTEKSYITLDEDPDRIKTKIKKAVTDAGTTGELAPGAKNLITILGEIDREAAAEYEAAGKAGTIRYGDLKSELADQLANYFQPFRERRADLASKPDEVWGILEQGRDQASKITGETIREVKDKMGFIERR